ncbi:hypothetical protein DL96DRAFT_1634740 [Flagelloscypha sp. PMI_526]|nr:hypothetical protein DL96DRAFT_1634740 [Flagelloscypha sp. PMI_526]
MAFDLSNFRLRGGHMKLNRSLQKRADCATGGLYLSPTWGASVDALKPLEIKWEPSCINGTDKIDIYLKAPQTTTPLLHTYSGVSASSGSYTVNLEPRWWNATANVQLQVSIFNHGDMPFGNEIPAGPPFQATYTAPTDGSTPQSADTSIKDSSSVTNVAAMAASAESSNKGKTAAAVLVPLLFLICLGILGYIKWQRVKQSKKTMAFSEKVDRRMSTVSGDWRSMTASGAKEAVRASMYQQDNSRFSTFSYGGRSSTYATEGSAGNAGIGSRGLYAQDNASLGNFDYVNGYSPTKTHTPRQRSHSNNVMRPSFTQSRVSFAESVSTPPSHLRNPRGSVAEGNRQSRVSFADGTRPSVDSRYSRSIGQGERGSRAFHSAFTIGQDEEVPPVPTRTVAAHSTGDSVSNVLSPKQRAGAFALSNDDINDQMMSRDDDEIGAAISYIQGPIAPLSLDNEPRKSVEQDVLFAVPPTPGGPLTASSTVPIAPSPTYSPTTPSGVFAQQQTASTKVAVSPLGPMPMGPGQGQESANFNSPDDMLRAYAMRQSQHAGMATPTSGMMTPGSAQPMMRAGQFGHGRKMSAWGEEDAYGGM